MSKFGTETVTSIHHWNDTLFSFRTTRDPGLRFENGHFVMMGLEVDGRPLVRAYSIASANHDEHLEFFSALSGLDHDHYRSKRAELLEITRLGPFVDRPAGQLSGGMYKKLGLMCALLRSPSVVLLDEPTNGVDPISRREFWELLYRLSRQSILILLTTAYMDEAERCARVHLLETGHLIAEGEPGALLEQEHVENFDQLFLKRSRAREKEGAPP